VNDALIRFGGDTRLQKEHGMKRTSMALIVLTGWAGAAQAQDTTITFGLGFDPATRATLTTRGEMVIVSAWYYGEPADPKVPVDEVGLVYLGGEDLTIFPFDQTITLGANLANANLGDVITPMININIFTARRTHEDNLIDCDFIDGPVADIAGQEPVLTCTLLNP